MKIKAVSATILTILLISLLTSAFNVQFSKAEKAANIESESTSGVWISTDWNRTYGGTSNDYASSVVQTAEGGYALAGYTYSYGVGTPGSPNFWLVKTDFSGNVAWSKTYGGTGTDYAYSLIRTSDGGYALAGNTNSYGAGGGDMWLVKTDSSGNAQWNKTYGASNVDYANSVIQTSDGGYALAGYTASYGTGGGDMWLVRTASNGSMLWSKTYGGAKGDSAYCVIETSDGGFAMAGYTNWQDIVVGGDLWLVKTNSAGTAQWNKTYGGTNWDEAKSVIQTSDGGYALAGVTRSFGAGLFDYWLIKTDSSGNAQWNKTYGGPNNDAAYSVIQTGDGGYAIAGGAFGDFCLVKTDPAGTMMWSRTRGGTGSDYANSLIQTSDAGYALAGSTNSFGAGGYDLWLAKLTPATIYIRADGSVDPSTAPIQRNGDLYTLTDNIYTSATYGIVISRNNTIVDGNEYTLQGSGTGEGFWGYGLNNVTIKNTNVRNFSSGIALGGSWNNTLSGNNMTNNYDCIYLYMSSNNNTVSGNNMADNQGFGVVLYSTCNNNTISRNNITNNGGVLIQSSSTNNVVYGNKITNSSSPSTSFSVYIYFSSNNTVYGNTIANSSGYGVQIYSSSFNAIFQNTIRANVLGVTFESSSYGNIVYGNNITNSKTSGINLLTSSNNSVYHNNVLNNADQVRSYDSVNVWDDGYPSGGNYWSDYTGVDLNHDLIGDTPHVLDADNSDRYPLMGMFGASTPTGNNITVFPSNDVGLIFETVTAEGSTTTNKTDTGPAPPSGFQLAGQYYDIKTTATHSGQITIRIIYDDSQMTQFAEESLRLNQWDTTLQSWTDITTNLDTANNVIYGATTHLSIFGIRSITPVPQEIVILNAACPKTVVCQGFKANITVTVINQGGSTKTFDVFAYANGTLIGSQTVSNLPPSQQTTIAFTWNTTSFAKGNYTVTAYDQLIRYVTVTMLGDLTGPIGVPDGKDDIRDLALVAKYFGQNVPPAPADCDLTGLTVGMPDGKIDIRDLAAAAKNYGRTDP